ncbi:amidase family protein [Mangrovibacter sp. SLW1]
MLQTGLGVTAVEYLQAQRYRTGLREQLLAALQDVDFILVPTLPFTAPRKGQERIDIAGNEESVLTGNMRFNALASLSGLPAISLPAGFDHSGLPIGMQLIGPDGSEGKLLALAARFQQDTDYHRQIPVLARS